MNHIPDEKQIEKLLEQVAPHTGACLESRLVSAPWTERAMHRRHSVYAIALAIIALTLIFAVTPQGNAVAQDVLLFFTRTESDSYYSPISDLTFEDTTPFHAECGLSYNPTCSVEQVRSMV